jgi:hypothetical protein
MQPGVLTRDGFLGDDPRRVSEIIDADRAALDRVGVPPDHIADRLQQIADAAMPALGATVHVLGLRAAYRDAMGRIACPFGTCGVFPKGEIELTGPDADRTVRFTPLSVHLIREHAFFEGRGSRYHLDPVPLARLLRLTEG